MELERALQNCLTALNLYRDILDSFVLDFFIDDHWKKLPENWREALREMNPRNLSDWLDPDKNSYHGRSKPLPLSLMALKKTQKTLSIERIPLESTADVLHKLRVEVALKGEFRTFEEEFSDSPSLFHVFRKHVKVKKQHEIVRLARIIKALAEKTTCSVIVDVGAGVGHLARLLSHHHDLEVVCLDNQPDFNDAAKRFDSDIAKCENLSGKRRPSHLTLELSENTKSGELDDKLQPRETSYGLVGLHTCGDLAAVLIRQFAQSPRASFVASVGCCYMKLSAMYPMSEYLSRELPNKSVLSYQAKELACHAIETYVKKLSEEEGDSLKVHCQRAALESIIAKKDETLRHSKLKTVKRSYKLPFEEYAKRATNDLSLEFRGEDFASEETAEKLNSWWKVVAFYSLRLSFAPLIESVILLDRLMYMREMRFNAAIVPLFEPGVSPRNHLLLAIKDTNITL